MGTSQKEEVIFGADQKRRYVGGSVTEDYLVITASGLQLTVSYS
jgi:prolyl oligopeptidase